VTVSVLHAAFLHVKPIAWALTWHVFRRRLESSSTPTSPVMTCYRLIGQPNRRYCTFFQSLSAWEAKSSAFAGLFNGLSTWEQKATYPPTGPSPGPFTGPFSKKLATTIHRGLPSTIKFVAVPHWTIITVESASWWSTWTMIPQDTTWWLR
jgi:hypothetical protein